VEDRGQKSVPHRVGGVQGQSPGGDLKLKTIMC